MCGFLAIVKGALPLDLVAARRALATLGHRGPDATGEWTEGDVFLGHQRLSILDLDTGDQPMSSVDGRYVLVFNGEIYNFRETRAELISLGAEFKTRSDTEVILAGYRQWGPRVVDHLQGMFAFVLWDRTLRTVFAARDRVGIKPLCWAMRQGSLFLSSTLEPLQALFASSSNTDMTALRDLMTFDYVPGPRTIFSGVSKLEPGSRLSWVAGSHEPTIERYWLAPLADRSATAPDEFELEQLLEKAVHRQMVSDVPIGVFLSGGIDSSLIVAMMARHSAEPVRTFSVAFAEGNVDESSIAQTVARRFGTEHTVLRAEDIGPEDLLALIGRLDEPFCDPAFVPTYALSAMTKRHVKVALSGDGGDEVFGGYSRYLLGVGGNGRLPFSPWLQRGLRGTAWRPRGMDRVYWRTLSQADRVRFSLTHYGDFPVFGKDLRQLFCPGALREGEIEDYFEPWERRAKRLGAGFDCDILMRADLETYLSDNCLVKTDRASMCASLEVRVPFLDELILDRVLPLPADKKLSAGCLKALLMPIARRLLPREVWDREKHGFTVPLDIRLAGAWRPAVDAALSWGEANLEIFDYHYLRRLHELNQAGGGIGRELWNPFVFLAWSMAHGR